MSKTADRLDRIEDLIKELVTLTQLLVLRDASDPSDLDVQDVTAPAYPPHLPPTLPKVAPIDPPVFPFAPDFPRKNTCSKCEMVFEGVMGYICNTTGCPMGCGPTTC